VTTYVREEMNRADRTGGDKRRMNLGLRCKSFSVDWRRHRPRSIGRSNAGASG
jgi:hypothetical protein